LYTTLVLKETSGIVLNKPAIDQAINTSKIFVKLGLCRFSLSIFTLRYDVQYTNFFDLSGIQLVLTHFLCYKNKHKSFW